MLWFCANNVSDNKYTEENIYIYYILSHGFFHISDVICPREGIFARDRRSRANVHFRGQITQLIWKNPCDNLYIACLVSIIQCFIWFLLIWIGKNTQSAHVSIVFWMFTLLGISTFSLWRCDVASTIKHCEMHCSTITHISHDICPDICPTCLHIT